MTETPHRQTRALPCQTDCPALLAGLEKLLAIIDLLETEYPDNVIQLARTTLPRFFNSA
jgi:hypothetical protein